MTEVGGNPGLLNESGLCNDPSPPNEGVLVGNELVVEVDVGNPGKLGVRESEIKKYDLLNKEIIIIKL